MDIKKLKAEMAKVLDNGGDDATVTAIVEKYAPAKITTDAVQTWMDTDEGKTFIKPIMDRRVSDSLKTYREKTFEPEVKKAVDAQLAEDRKKSELSPEQKELAEMKAAFKQLREDNASKERRASRSELAANKKIPVAFAVSLDGKLSSEEVESLADELVKWNEATALEISKQKLKTSVKPGGGTGGKDETDDSKKSYADFVAEEEAAVAEADRINASPPGLGTI